MKILLAGQGLAGSVLAMQLLERGVSVHVVGRERPGAASPVAAGVFNPLTGRKPVETWLAGTIFPYLQAFYPRLEAQLGARFYFAMPNVRPFHTPEERAQAEGWLDSPAVARWARLATAAELEAGGLVRAAHGGLVVQQAGYVEVGVLTEAARRSLTALGLYEEGVLNDEALLPHPGGYEYKGVLYDRVIFCTGRWAPLPGLAPLKGEILKVTPSLLSSPPAEGEGLLFVLNRNGYLAPRPDGAWWAGSTYQHHFQEEGPTEAGRGDILNRVSRNVTVPIQVLEHRAGIRPSVKDRRPLLGFLQNDPRIGHFNGLGTKGVSLAPWLAQVFCDHLLEGVALPAEVDVNRFQFKVERLK